MEQDIRWQQRFAHYTAALQKLDSALAITHPSEVERAGIIQIFEFTAELAWNTLKDYLEYQGETDITGSRDAINLAFQRGLLSDGLAWLEMLKSRNLSSHIYDETVAAEILSALRGKYQLLLQELQLLLTRKLN